MAQETKMFNPVDLLKFLIKEAGIKEGIWMLTVQFGGAATNVINEVDGRALPSFFVSVEAVGLTKVDELSPLAIDAATLY